MTDSLSSNQTSQKTLGMATRSGRSWYMASARGIEKCLSHSASDAAPPEDSKPVSKIKKIANYEKGDHTNVLFGSNPASNSLCDVTCLAAAG